MCYNLTQEIKGDEGKKNTRVFYRELGQVKASNTRYFEWVWSLFIYGNNVIVLRCIYTRIKVVPRILTSLYQDVRFFYRGDIMRKFEKISFEQFKKDVKDDKELYESYSLPKKMY